MFSPLSVVCSRLRNIKAIDFGNIIAEPYGYSRNISSCGFAGVDFILQVFNLFRRCVVLECTVQIMIGSVVMNGVCTEISQLIHIPFGIVGIGIQAVPDIAGLDHFVSLKASVP